MSILDSAVDQCETMQFAFSFNLQFLSHVSTVTRDIDILMSM